MALADCEGVIMTNDPNSGGFVYDHAKRKFVTRDERLRSLLYKALHEFSPEEVDAMLDQPLPKTEPEQAAFSVEDFITNVQNMDEPAKEAYMSYVRPLIARTPKDKLPTEQEVHQAHYARVDELIEKLSSDDVLFDAKKRQEVVDELNILSPPQEAKRQL